MKIYRLQETEILPVSLDTAWEFFSNPHNLAVITPPGMGLTVRQDLPAAIYPGMIITYRIRVLGGIPVTWVTEITHIIEGKLFVDEQRFGPYKFWHHEHHFREVQDGTEVTDSIYYALPLGFLGRIAHALLVRRQLSTIFNFRRGMLRETFPPHAR